MGVGRGAGQARRSRRHGNHRRPARKLDDVPAQESVRLAGLGHLYAGRQVASAITRVWWPVVPLPHC